jgi:hypothetical protein
MEASNRLWRLLMLLAGIGKACGQGKGARHHPTSSVPVQPQTQADEAAAAKSCYRRGLRRGGFQSPTGNIGCGPNSKDPTELPCDTLCNGNGAAIGLTGPVGTSRKVRSGVAGRRFATGIPGGAATSGAILRSRGRSRSFAIYVLTVATRALRRLPTGSAAECQRRLPLVYGGTDATLDLSQLSDSRD